MRIVSDVQVTSPGETFLCLLRVHMSVLPPPHTHKHTPMKTFSSNISLKPETKCPSVDIQVQFYPTRQIFVLGGQSQTAASSLVLLLFTFSFPKKQQFGRNENERRKDTTAATKGWFLDELTSEFSSCYNENHKKAL